MRTRLAALSLVVFLGLSAPALAWYDVRDDGVQTKKSQAALSPDGALKLLKEGNKRFAAGKLENQDRYRRQVSATSTGQFPYAAILSCLDSRVGVEQIFDLNNGDAFVGRVAGNVFNPDMLGSFEFATRLAGSKLIVVLGHTQCGAVKGACDDAELGNLTGLLDRIEPAVDLVSKNWMDGMKNSKNAKFVDAVGEANVRLARDSVVRESPVIKALVDEGKVMIVGAVYDLETGIVRFLD